MTELQYLRIQRKAPELIVQLTDVSGDVEAMERQYRELDYVIRQYPKMQYLHIDVSLLRRCPMEIVRSFLAAHGECQRRGGAMSLLHANDEVVKRLKSLNLLDRVLTCDSQ